MGSTKKFTDFVLEFLPKPPNARPEAPFQHPWTTKAMKKSMSIIYKYRSRALHGGIPFPAPMCHAPILANNKVAEEKPFGLSTSMKGGVWMAKDLPLHLHTFEYITRSTIMNWFSKETAQEEEEV
jgi:hypothetical protein